MADDEYERERQENIRKNRELMLSLGLNPAESSRNSLQFKKTPKAPRRSKIDVKGEEAGEEQTGRILRNKRSTSTLTRASAFPEPVRKSARLSTQSSISYNEDDENMGRKGAGVWKLEESDDDKKQDLYLMPKLKKIRNPSPPPQSKDFTTEIYTEAPIPQRQANGNIIFEDNNRHFMPNVTPKEMIQGGIFGGTAFRPFYSRVLKRDLNPDEEMAEFPDEWFEGIPNMQNQLNSTIYDPEINRFGVKAGQTLEDWENNGWVHAQDPRGWWQWYFRFYQGRRTSDDARQIGRWLKACGPAGRFKRSVVAKIHRAGASWDDESITPVVRQTLFHWAYQLTEQDYLAYMP